MASEDSARLTALLTPSLGDWLYWPAATCAAGHLMADELPQSIGAACVACVWTAAEMQIPHPHDGDTASQHAAWERRLVRGLKLLANPDPAWVIGRGVPKNLDDPDRLWAAWGRWLAQVRDVAPMMQVHWSANTSHWVGAWPTGPRHHYQHFAGDTPANALRAAWLAQLDTQEEAP